MLGGCYIVLIEEDDVAFTYFFRDLQPLEVIGEQVVPAVRTKMSIKLSSTVDFRISLNNSILRAQKMLLAPPLLLLGQTLPHHTSRMVGGKATPAASTVKDQLRRVRGY